MPVDTDKIIQHKMCLNSAGRERRDKELCVDSEHHFKLACMGQFYSYVQIYADASKPTNPAGMARAARVSCQSRKRISVGVSGGSRESFLG